MPQEYGHYTTAAEAENVVECPVCFDPPHRPVTLSCNHIFCECCIHEWLEREKSCPVCRAVMTSDSKYLGALKAEPMTFTMPIVF
jgi:hypothetical protein